MDEKTAQPLATPAHSAEKPACPSCSQVGSSVFYEHEGVPVHSCRLLDSRAEALEFPRGSLRLAACTSCGFIWNLDYDGSVQDYSASYEETQGFSPTFRAFADDLAARWVEKYGLRDKLVLEIGCGKGEFLVSMCELGGNSGIGIDPSYVEDRLENEALERISVIRDLYSERYADLAADAIVCRHTLEHIPEVGELLRLLRRAVERRPDTVLLFELPDVRRVLREVAFWDLYYEHCSYFSPGSLARLFRSAGFDVLNLELAFDDQYIIIEGRLGSSHRLQPLEEDVPTLLSEIEQFRTRLPAVLRAWQLEVAGAKLRGERIVLWGAGSKAVAFLNRVGLRDEIDVIVDINPFKQNTYSAGTGEKIVAPEFLATRPPGLVIVMNPVYLDEIRRQLEQLGVSARVVVAGVDG